MQIGMNTKHSKSIGVIGSGLGGLAAACTLAARGHSVRVFEANAWTGGKAAVLQLGAFRFDMGPTILTLPSVLRRIFLEAGRPLTQELDLVRLDPQWRSFFQDGSVLDLTADIEGMSKNLQRFSNDAATVRGYRRLMELSARLHTITDRYYFYRPVGGIGDMFSAQDLARPAVLRDVLAMRPLGTVAGTIRSHVPDARVAQMLDHFTQYVGSAPDQSPAVLCGIANMQTQEGVWYPMGGIGEVPSALRRLAEDLGVEFLTGTCVRRIVERDGMVRGVETDAGERIDLAAVISNSDSVRTHAELLGPEFAKKFRRTHASEPACSGVVLYLGLKERYKHLLHHGFAFSADPHEEFHHIYRRGEPAPDPTCYICAPAATDPSVAPEGGEALYVLVHVPYLRPHHNWRTMLPAYRKRILSKLASTAGLEDLEQRIQVERVLTPEDIHTRYRVLNGAIYGLASHGRLFGAFKPSNRSPLLRGLYLAGGSAHPGPGMPMALMSGWTAADALHEDLGLSRPPGNGVELETRELATA